MHLYTDLHCNYCAFRTSAASRLLKVSASLLLAGVSSNCSPCGPDQSAGGHWFTMFAMARTVEHFATFSSYKTYRLTCKLAIPQGLARHTSCIPEPLQKSLLWILGIAWHGHGITLFWTFLGHLGRCSLEAQAAQGCR